MQVVVLLCGSPRFRRIGETTELSSCRLWTSVFLLGGFQHPKIILEKVTAGQMTSKG